MVGALDSLIKLGYRPAAGICTALFMRAAIERTQAGCSAVAPMNRRPPQIAAFFEKLMSCPMNAGVPADNQKECEIKVAGIRNAKSARAARRDRKSVV